MYSVPIYFFCRLSAQPRMGLHTLTRTPSRPLLEVRRFAAPLLVAGTAAMSTGDIYSSVWFVKPKLRPPSLGYVSSLLFQQWSQRPVVWIFKRVCPRPDPFFFFFHSSALHTNGTPSHISHIWFHS